MPLIVIRQLPHAIPVIHCIVRESTDPKVDDQDHYMTEIATDAIDSFKKQFPEFNFANFHFQFVDNSIYC